MASETIIAHNTRERLSWWLMKIFFYIIKFMCVTGYCCQSVTLVFA